MVPGGSKSAWAISLRTDRSERPCHIPLDIDPVSALLSGLLERPVLPAAPWCMYAEERDRDLPLEWAGCVVVEQIPVADNAFFPES